MSRFAEDLLFILIVLIIAAILGFLLAWFLRQRRIRVLEREIYRLGDENKRLEAQSKVQAQAAVQTQQVAQSTDQQKADFAQPAFNAAAARSALGKRIVEDDLTMVEGIGPKISSLLNKSGTHTWRELAELSPADIQKVLDAAGTAFRIHDPGTWPKQAELAANGDWEGLQKMQDGLKGGRARASQ